MMRWTEDPTSPAEESALSNATWRRMEAWIHIVTSVVTLALLLTAVTVGAQETRISDLTVSGGDVPVRLVGYGLVVGLDGTGDRVAGGFSSGHTVRSVANLLRRFDVEVPENMLRTRNVAAVLVTAEVSPYLRPGGRFDVHVSSLGDAQSLRGGVLWMTPLQGGPTVDPVATAQGPLLISEASPSTNRYTVETTASLPDGGILEGALPRLEFGVSPVLHLRRPDLVTASRIADVINESVAPGIAVVEDPGSVSLTLPEGMEEWDARRLADIGALPVQPGRSARVVIDSRSGTVIAGGDITIGEAVVSHGELTLAIGASTPADPLVFGDLRMNPGVSVQDIAAALHGVAARPEAIAAVFESLRQVGALTAEVSLR